MRWNKLANSQSRSMTVQVIDRAVQIMRVVAQSGPISLTVISRRANLPLPTAARIVKGLTENGILQRLDNRKYHLGVRLLPLATPLEPFRKLLQVAHPFIEGLARKTREDCGLAVLQGNEAVVVDWCYGSQAPRIIEPYVRKVPVCCAFGVVLIAFQQAKWRERFLRTLTLEKVAKGTVPNRDDLSEKIENTRRTGFYVSFAENVEGAGSLTVPVFDHISRLLGALFVTAPLTRFSESHIMRYKVAVLDAANSLTGEIRRQRHRRVQPSGCG
jgi:IclR family KDG regulon transcriptional repressor